MRFFEGMTIACLLTLHAPALAHPQPITDMQQRREAVQEAESIFAPVNDLWKRKGGGGGSGKGGGASSSAGKGGSSGTSSGSTSTGRGSPSSNAGGSTKTGSGVRPNYGGGRYYGGGATTPYTAGARSPLGIAPVFLGVGLLSIYPGLWLYGAYSYPYGNPYSFYNRTGRQNSTSTATRDLHLGELETRQDDAGVNETKPVTCLCAAYLVCGCDDNNNSTFLDSIIGDGTYSALNHSLVTVADVNGTSTILLNGTLPNGTTAAGGTEDATSGSSFGAVRFAAGHLVMIFIVGLTCFAI
ncbi:conserved glycine-rich protein [Diplocarpon rosae]|nr:conserved glycine-rich protein [Diplocarpon rosae]